MRVRILVIVERGLWTAGLVFVVVFAAAMADREIGYRKGLRDFDHTLQARDVDDRPRPAAGAGAPDALDFSRWSGQRVLRYRAGAAAEGAPLAVVRIPKCNLRAPVFSGTRGAALNRGVGWIPGTARPGEAGNIGIAGHRDSFFRELKDLQAGDAIEIETTRDTAAYTVDQVEIVEPDDVRVLGPRAKPAVTLVTCYPFYFIGNAPKRFVVHAQLSSRRAAVNGEIWKSEEKEKQK